LGARGRIGVDFASFETCVYTVARRRGEQEKTLSPLLLREKGLGDEGSFHVTPVIKPES